MFKKLDSDQIFFQLFFIQAVIHNPCCSPYPYGLLALSQKSDIPEKLNRPQSLPEAFYDRLGLTLYYIITYVKYCLRTH